MSITEWIIDKVHPAVEATEAEVQRLRTLLGEVTMTMQSLESIVSDISSKVDKVKVEVDDLIARLGGVSPTGGLTAAEVATLTSDLQAVSDKFASIATEPAV